MAMITKNEKLKTVIKWYDIMLSKKIIPEHFYKKFMYAIQLTDKDTLDRFYEIALEKLADNVDWEEEYDLL